MMHSGTYHNDDTRIENSVSVCVCVCVWGGGGGCYSKQDWNVKWLNSKLYLHNGYAYV